MNKRKVNKNKGLAVIGIVKRIVKPFTSVTSWESTEKLLISWDALGEWNSNRKRNYQHFPIQNSKNEKVNSELYLNAN